MDKTIVITIHGTFANKATWAEPGSPLMQSIQEKFSKNGMTCEVVPFRWSGKNTINAQVGASKELSAFINDHLKNKKEKPRVLVLAHSHGGSVFAYCLYHNLISRNQIAGFVAMPTPWITVRSERFLEEMRLFFARFFSVSVLLSFLAWFVPQIQEKLITSIDCEGRPLESSVDRIICAEESIFLVTELFFSIFVGTITGLIWVILHTIIIRMVKRSNNNISKTMTKYANDTNLSNVQLPPTVVMVSKGDEASSLLRVIQWFSSVSREILGRIYRVGISSTQKIDNLSSFKKTLYLITFAVFTCVSCMTIILIGSSPVIPLPLQFSVYVLVSISTFGIITALISAIVYGSYNIYLQLYCRFGVEITPYGKHQLIMLKTLDRDYAPTDRNNHLLKHSGIYILEENIDIIADTLVGFNREYCE